MRRRVNVYAAGLVLLWLSIGALGMWLVLTG